MSEELKQLTDTEIAELLTWPIQSLGVKCRTALLELQTRRKQDAIVDELLGALKGLLVLNEKQFRMLEETTRRGLSTMTPAGVKFDDLKFIKLSRAAIQKAEEAGIK